MKKEFNVAQWIIGFFFVLCALVNGIHLSTLLLLAAAVLIMPIPQIRNALMKVDISGFKIKQWMIVVLSVLLFFVGTLVSPLGENADNPNENPSYSDKDGLSGEADEPDKSSGEGSDSSDDKNIDNETSDSTDEETNGEETNGEENDDEIIDEGNVEDDLQGVPEDTPTLPVIPEDVPTITPSVGNGIATPVDPSKLPDYSGSPYAIVENNIPSFSSDELTVIGYEKYSSLDAYGRCGVAIASCGKEIMPLEGEERGSISSIKPSGWIQASYSGISGGYLWNRCHLIGWQLSAENANRKNLITGTRYMNVSGMLPFENMIADYITETENHVAFRVTPIFEGDNLVCSGVQMEAYSVEDNGEGICFNVYCYNVQPGIVIDYATGASSASNLNFDDENNNVDKEQDENKEENSSENSSEGGTETVWIPQTGSKYHTRSNCSNMKDPREVTLEEAEERGFTPCKRCH